jgi:hypothetical protein
MSDTERAILSDPQRDLLRAVLNRLIPAAEQFPGAGDLGVGAVIERSLTSGAARRQFLDGLVTIDVTSWRVADATFTDLSGEQQDTILQGVERAAPEFFDLLVNQTYRGYYVNPTVIALVGAEARPPQPIGHVLPGFDPTLLAKVRARGPIFRRIES